MNELALHWLRCQPRTTARSGAVIVAALVCLLIVMTMIGAMLQTAMRARRQMHAERDLRQTELLLQAGMQRAAVRIANESEYRGETWSLPADQIAGRSDGRVSIVTSRASNGEPWQVRVVAEYPLGGETSIRRSRTFTTLFQSPSVQE